MIIQQITLNNIRSYVNETITFPKGSILLSGDIGSGKSSILLAIEFALFGASRTDLPAEALLRKGCTQGSVQLTFLLNSQEITIERNLKKSKDSIAQSSSYLIINHQKKELMPVEIKAEILTLLGYPEDLLTKSKNYIFRYTVYTPQEEMRYILEEDAENRLDTLRKIFNLDKYKVVRENLQEYLKQMRTKIALLHTKSEPLEEYKEKWRKVKSDEEQLHNSLQEVHCTLSVLKQEVESKREELEQLENDQKKFMEWQQKIKTNQLLMNDKREQLINLEKKKEEIIAKISQFSMPKNISKELVENNLHQLEQQKSEVVIRQFRLEDKNRQLQEKLLETQQELLVLEKELSTKNKKEEALNLLHKELAEKSELKNRKELLDQYLHEIDISIAQNKLKAGQAQNLKEKVATLDTCPTCLQTVSAEHKEKIQVEEQNKIEKAKRVLIKLESTKNNAALEKENIDQQIELLIEKEKICEKTKLELQLILDKESQLAERKEQLENLALENNSLTQQLEELKRENNLELLNKNIADDKELLNKLLQENQLQKQLEELKNLIEEHRQRVGSLEEEKKMLGSCKKENLTVIITEKKENYHLTFIREREMAVIEAEIKTKISNCITREEELQHTITKLNEHKILMVEYKELHRWLEDYFVKLTYAIEKEMMLNLHRLFNQLFQEWFSVLIDDENIISRIDDSFTPVIEQDGYEISVENLSGGEKTSAALAYRLALNRVINDVVHEIKTKELLILDEPTDGFSTEQLDKVRDVLEKLQLKQMIIVSHETKIESFVEHVVRVKKENGISRII